MKVSKLAGKSSRDGMPPGDYWYHRDMQTVNLYEKYYEENIKPILDISEAYNIDFNNEIPFEYFGSEEEINMYTFSSYYMDIIKKMGIDVKSIVTIEKSAGKYEMKVDENIIDVRAWDKLDDVFENIKTIKELFKEKNKENEYAK